MTEILQFLFDGAEIIGTIAFAVSGAMLAIDRGLDLFGVLFLGVVTACGGGIMRDVILGIVPPSAFSNSVFVMVAAVASVVVFLFAYLQRAKYWSRWEKVDHDINLMDAIGLGVFSVVGANVAMEQGFADNFFLCVMMGMSTGVGGGILRDLLSRTIPAVLHKRIYAVASIIGAALYCGLIRWGAPSALSMLCGIVITVVIRVMATHYLWDLPVVRRD